MITLVERRRAELAELCRRYRVKRLDLFGSAARGAFRADTSDLDFIVSFEGAGERGYATRYYEFAEALEALFGRHVDLLTERMISTPYFREEVQQTRETIYGQGSQGQPVEGEEQILVRVIPDRGELAHRLLGAGREFAPERDAVAELIRERAAEG
jgi:uncharacterized protein